MPRYTDVIPRRMVSDPLRTTDGLASSRTEAVSAPTRRSELCSILDS